MATVDVLNEERQLAALTPEVMRAYADGALPWSQIRQRFGVVDFTLVLRRLGEEDLRLPRARADRSTEARLWLREVLQRQTRG